MSQRDHDNGLIAILTFVAFCTIGIWVTFALFKWACKNSREAWAWTIFVWLAFAAYLLTHGGR